MMKLFCIFLLFFITCIAQQTHKVSSSRDSENIKIDDILGGERVKLINAAKKINLFRIGEFTVDPARQRKGKKKRKYFADYEILRSATLKKRQLKNFKQSLLNASNYGDINLIDKCTFAATAGFEIKTGKRTIRAVVSYPCRQMIILENGQELYRTIDKLEIFDSIFQNFFSDLPKVNEAKLQ